jgi:two-component system chemotaxis response regulator CheB
VFVVVHLREDAPSQLPTILNRVGVLPAAHAVADEPIRRGRIYVAPPGLQTYVHRGRLSVRRGPRENMHRPSIDALFRTAAHHYGPRVVGVVLSGALDDGSAGLLAVKKAGGIAIVQDPADAKVPDMPANALERADADYTMAADAIAPMLMALVDESDAELLREVPLDAREDVHLETVEEATVPQEAMRSEELGPPSNVTCPECSGTLFEIDEGKSIRFRCRVGHAYSEESLMNAQTDSVERALWTALRALEERVALINKIAEFARRRGHDMVAALFEGKAQQVDADVKTIHDVIVNGGTLEPIGQDSR